MKTLVIVTHPNLRASKVNKKFVEESEKYEIRKLYELYPNEKIAVDEEQKAIEQFDKIVFQFPVYWYNCPSLLKKWFDEVLTYDWAYSNEYRLEGKQIATNGNKEDYQANGKNKYTLIQLTNSFETSFNYIKADYKSFYVFYGSNNATLERIEKGAKEYLKFIDSF